jgi:hypothetical protein
MKSEETVEITPGKSFIPTCDVSAPQKGREGLPCKK